MNDKKNFVVGVLGVATYATINFFEQWAKVFPAEKEWDRPRIIIDNNCTLPSRVRALLYNENVELLVEGMTTSIKTLIQAGASKVLIACNTAHVFLPAIYEKFPQAREFVFDIADSCVERLKRRGVKKLSCLPAKARFFPACIKRNSPTRELTAVRRRPKNSSWCATLSRPSNATSSRPKSKLNSSTSAVAEMFRGGGIILGCTELPVMRDKCADKLVDVKFFDPMPIALEDLKAEFDTLPN